MNLRPLLLAFALIVTPVVGQTYVPMSDAKVQFLDNSADPCSSCKLYVYETGTTTLQDSWTDSTGGTANANPVVTDSSGRANVWLNKTRSYKFKLDTSADVTLWTVDNVASQFSSSTITVGSGSAADIFLNYDGNATDFTICLDDSGDDLIIANGTTCGSNSAITIQGDGTEDVTIAADLTVLGPGPHAVGGALLDYGRMSLRGNYTSGGASSLASLLYVDGALTGASGDTTSLAQVHVTGSIATQNVGNTIATVATLILDEATITANDTVTNSATLYISGVASEATNDYAIWVDDGNVRVDGAGPHSWGGSTQNNFAHFFRGSYTSGGATTTAAAAFFNIALTAASGDTDWLSEVSISPTITTSGASEVITTVSSLRIAEPTITIATSTITNSATLYVEGPATEATNNYAIWVDAGSVRFDEAVFSSGGNPAVGYYRFYASGNFESDGSSSVASNFVSDGRLIGANGDTSGLHGARFIGQIHTQGNSETIQYVSSVHLGEPQITVNTGDSVTTAATLWIANAPTEATNNFALHVDSGNSRFGAVGTNDAFVHIISPSASTRGLVIEVPSPYYSEAFQIHVGGTAYLETSMAASESRLSIMNVDLGNDSAGPVFTIGRNTNSTNANSGTLVFRDVGNTQQFIWVDDSASPGDVRINTSPPSGGTADTAGTIVGTQSSPKFIKNILHEWTDEEAFRILDQVLETPVYDFTYKSGKYGQHFTGIAIEDGDHPWYGFDPAGSNDYVPEGTAKALNQLNMAGYTILSIRALNQKIERLENEITLLFSSHTVAGAR
jgi:hypothetical protein